MPDADGRQPIPSLFILSRLSWPASAGFFLAKIATVAGIEEPPITGGRRSNLYQRRAAVCAKHCTRALNQS